MSAIPLEFIERQRVYVRPRIYQIDPWHPLLWSEVRIWYNGRIQTRVCTEVRVNENFGRFDGELLPMAVIIDDNEYAIIRAAIKELNNGR